jgi:hypothetical protein
MFQSKLEKEKLVIDLYSQGKTYRQIAEQVGISPNDIHAILEKEERTIVLLLITRNNLHLSPKPMNCLLREIRHYK